VIIIAVAAVIGAAFAVFTITENNNERSFTVTYYSSGEKLLDTSVPSGTYVTVYGELGRGDHGRFVGWNTKHDLSGKTLAPGSQLKVDGNISLYAVTLGSGVFAVMLPEEQKGYSISADPSVIVSGGGSVLSYALLPGYIDDDLVIAVNGYPIKLDAMKKIHLADITDDQWVTVTGVHDKREHSISLPADQKGYVLTSSAEKVHHGESYTLEYRLLPGFRESYDFGIHVNGGDPKLPSGGTLLIEDVKDNHFITVTGIELIGYSVSSGKNTSVLVNGEPSSVATIEDFLTVVPDKGYVIPNTFSEQIKGDFTDISGGYRITGNVVFPSVLKITAGENTKIDGSVSDSIFVCPADEVNIVPASGYSLPGNYVDAVRNLNGVKYSAERFFFSNDLLLPSIYKVVFNGYNKVHSTFFVINGDECPVPTTIPLRNCYLFGEWQMNTKNIVGNVQIDALWVPIEYKISFGKNIHYSINGKSYFEPGNYIVTVEDLITTYANAGYELPSGYIPQTAIKNGVGYSITSDCTLPSIHYVMYIDEITNLSKKFYCCEFDLHTIVNPKIQTSPSFTFNLDNTGYDINDFIGWTCKGQLYENDTIIVDRDIMFLSSWK